MTWKFIALAKEKGLQRVQDTSVSLGEAELVGENQVYTEEWYLEMSSEGKEGNRIRKVRHLQKRMKNKTKNWLKKKKKKIPRIVPSSLAHKLESFLGWKERVVGTASMLQLNTPPGTP